MKKKYEIFHLEQEERYWWNLTRKEIILALITKCPSGCSILDIGCSGGAVIKSLMARGHQVNGIDISPEAIDTCLARGISPQQVKQADATRTGFAADQFDVLIASDVLEHIEKEEEALREWRRILKPGGKLIIFVPAYNLLFSDHDRVNMHYRRYSLPRLKMILQTAGLRPVRGSYWNVLALLPVILVRFVISRLRKAGADNGEGSRPLGTVANQILCGILRLENWLLAKGINFPFGVSVFCVAQKE